MSRAYKPKRASKRWTEDAPEYVLACYDNGGRTFDRYTVLFGGSLWGPELGQNVAYLGMSHDPSDPRGFSQWGEMPAFNRSACGKHVRWLDLPQDIRDHVRARAESSENTTPNE